MHLECRIQANPAHTGIVSQTMLETTEIARITPTGVELRDGRTHELDVLICATGFDTSFQYPFSVLGRGGQTLSERWATAKGPEAYLSLAVDGFPNLFVCSGPNSAVTSGSLLTVAEHVVGYVVEAVQKMQRERLRSMEVRQEAVQDWSSHVQVSELICRVSAMSSVVGLLTRSDS
jgi:cation diffusion facilitator CzcD-associated flavoprotein CzcO